MVLLLQAAEILGVIGAGALGKTGDEGLVDRHRGGELINKELEVPGELHDLIVGAGRRARRGARGRGGCRLGGGRTEEQKAAHDGEETHLSCDSTIDCQDMIGKVYEKSIGESISKKEVWSDSLDLRRRRARLDTQLYTYV